MSSWTPACRDALTTLLAEPRSRSDERVRNARAHVARCPGCASVLDDDAAAQRVLDRLQAHRPSPSVLLRGVLAVVATAQLVVAMPWLFGYSLVPDHDVTTAHLTRDGALGLAVAVLGLVVVWRPRYAVVALMLGCVVFVAQTVTSVFDEQGQAVSLAFELTHLLLFAVLGLVGIVSSSRNAPRGEFQRSTRPFRSL